ncbi:MAG: Nudix family hydrolase [Thiobacillaceae bacterium]|jgi:8-oxo-dGTP diphosphatase|nr:Nudix family hydrolase [Thiobacillaceae bacterium]
MTNRVEVSAAVIERPDGAFLMASRPPGKVYAGWWEFPGGKVEPGETPRQALDRELREELGIAVRQAYPWLVRDYDYEHARVRLNFFRVVDWAGEPHPHEGQGMAWVHAERPEVAPILPANGPILKGLSLPLTYAISAAAELGESLFLDRLEARLGAGLRLVQLREKGLPADRLARLAREVAARCREHGARLLVNGDLALAADCADGAHLPSARLMALEARPDLPWAGASCHDARELEHAARLGLDFVVLGPVLPTASHPGAASLDWTGFAALAAGRPMPVFALGGLAPTDLDRARRAGAHGIAMKRGIWT